MEIFFQGKIFTLDHNQLIAFHKLQNLCNIINQSSNFSKLLFWQKSVNSLYIYGNVGRGKSMLMNHFFQSVTKDKIYFHFNDFMQKIHRNLHKIRAQNINNKNILHIVINNIIGNSKIICLDEFQVADVVDAMILSDIFTYIFRKRIIVIFTSNSHPEDLYQNGLQRKDFLAFVQNILYKKCDILNLDGEYDYRQQNIDKNSDFLSPINKFNDNIFTQKLQNKINHNSLISWQDEILGRKILIKETYQDIALIDFNDFFGQNSGVVDYSHICKIFKTIFIKNIPILNNLYNNEAKRFILFLDEAYENNVHLVILSQNSIDKIYENGLLYDLFQRAASRLKELTTIN